MTLRTLVTAGLIAILAAGISGMACTSDRPTDSIPSQLPTNTPAISTPTSVPPSKSPRPTVHPEPTSTEPPALVPTPTDEPAPAPKATPMAAAPTPTATPRATPVLRVAEIELGDTGERATLLVAGGGIEAGTIDHEGDSDFFAFQAKEGEIYQIAVTPSTLPRIHVELSDIRGYLFPLYEKDNEEDHAVAQFLWMAPDSDEYAIAVTGYWGNSETSDRPGTYAVSVEIAGVDDDHSNVTAGATPLSAGQEIAGNLDYIGDTDTFLLDLEVGDTYRIGTSLGTLEDSKITIGIESDLEWVEADDHDALAAVAYWQVPRLFDSDEQFFYLQVSGWRTGTYTVSVSPVDRGLENSPLASFVDPGPGTNFISPNLWSILQRHASGETDLPETLEIGLGYYAADLETYDNPSVLDAIGRAGGVQLEEWSWEIPTANALSVIQHRDVHHAEIIGEMQSIEENNDTLAWGSLPLVLEAYRLGIPDELAAQYAMFIRGNSVAAFIGWEVDPEDPASDIRDEVRHWLESRGVFVPRDDSYGHPNHAALIPVSRIGEFMEAFPTAYIESEERDQGLSMTRWRWPVVGLCFEQGIMAGVAGDFDPEADEYAIPDVRHGGLNMAEVCRGFK